MATAAPGAMLTVNLVTPRGKIAAGETDAITAPGELGEFEVFPGHVPYLTELHHGVLVLGEKQARKVYAVGPGFLAVDAHGQVQVLVEQAVAAADADLEAAKATLGELGPKLREWKQALDGEYRNLKARHDWAKAQVDARDRIPAARD